MKSNTHTIKTIAVLWFRLYLHAETSCPFKVRGHVPPLISERSGFWMQLPRDKKQPNSIFFIWYNQISVIKSFSTSYHQLLYSNLCSLEGAEPDKEFFFTALRIITNCTWCCWAYECNDQSEVFRWFMAKMPAFSSLARWLKYLFLANTLVKNNKVQMCVWICK